MSKVVLKWLKLKGARCVHVREVGVPMHYTTLQSGNLWINIESTSYGKQEILSVLHKFIIPFWFPEC